MTDDRMALKKAEDGNFLRSLAETVLQILTEANVEGTGCFFNPLELTELGRNLSEVQGGECHRRRG